MNLESHTASGKALDVDLEGCISSGMCTAVAPSLFELDAKSRLIVKVEGELQQDVIGEATEAVDVCPVQAIRLLKVMSADD